jgi:hypothetical protein
MAAAQVAPGTGRVIHVQIAGRAERLIGGEPSRGAAPPLARGLGLARLAEAAKSGVLADRTQYSPLRGGIEGCSLVKDLADRFAALLHRRSPRFYAMSADPQ